MGSLARCYVYGNVNKLAEAAREEKTVGAAPYSVPPVLPPDSPIKGEETRDGDAFGPPLSSA